jgi:hypothetical protein
MDKRDVITEESRKDIKQLSDALFSLVDATVIASKSVTYPSRMKDDLRARSITLAAAMVNTMNAKIFEILMEVAGSRSEKENESGR